jgi:hypothetical protein
MLERRIVIGTKLDRRCRCGHPFREHSSIVPHRCAHKAPCDCIAFDSPAGEFSAVRFDDDDE